MKKRNNFQLASLSVKSNKKNTSKKTIQNIDSKNKNKIHSTLNQNLTKNNVVYTNNISDEDYYKKYYITEDNNEVNLKKNVNIRNIGDIENVNFSVSCISDIALENDIKKFYNRIYDLSNLLKSYNDIGERITREQILFNFDDLFKSENGILGSILSSTLNSVLLSVNDFNYITTRMMSINENISFIGHNFIYDVFFNSTIFNNFNFYKIQDNIFNINKLYFNLNTNIFESATLLICASLFLIETYFNNKSITPTENEYIELYNSLKENIKTQYADEIILSLYTELNQNINDGLEQFDIIFTELVSIFTKYRNINIVSDILDKNNENNILNYEKNDSFINIFYNINTKIQIDNDKEKQLVLIKNSDTYNSEIIYIYITKNTDGSIIIKESKELPYIIGIENDTNFNKFIGSTNTTEVVTASELLQIEIKEETDVFTNDTSSGITLEKYVNDVSLNFTNQKNVNDIQVDDIVNGIIGIFSLLEISPDIQSFLNNIPFIGLLFILNINDTMDDIITKSKEIRGNQTNGNIGINIEKGIVKGLIFILDVLEKSYKNTLESFLNFKVNEDTEFELYANYIDQVITPKVLLENSITDIVTLIIDFLNKTCAVIEKETFDELKNTINVIIKLIVTLLGGNVNININTKIGKLLNEPIEMNNDGSPYNRYSDFFDTSFIFKSELNIRTLNLH